MRLLKHANELFKKGQVAEASRTYRKILKARPSHGDANLALADLALQQNELPTANRHLKRAEKELAQSGRYWLARGDYELRASNADAAKTCYEQARDFGASQIDVGLRLGHLYQTAQDYQRAVDSFQAVLTLSPGHPMAEIGMGDILSLIGQSGLALRRYSSASAQPNQAAENLAKQRMRALIGNTIQRWHFPMMNDAPRNAAFQSAIRASIKPNDVVLDIGTGSSLLALMAADAGAGQVYACDDNPKITTAAKQVVRANGFQDRIKVIQKRSTQLVVGEDMAHRADALICEIFDAGFFGEDALATIQHAKTQLLKPGATLVPDGVRIIALPVFSESLNHSFSVDTVCGFTLSPFNALRDPRLLQVELERFEYTALAEPYTAVELNFNEDIPLSGAETKAFIATASATCHGIVFWYELLQDGEPFMTTGPGQAGTHWRQAFLPILENRPTLTLGNQYRLKAEFQRFLIWFEFVS
ncbi:MAG: tetratricopeptide repeat protein [Myxococcota bacterium]|nr:tetratricopeptide repeat protein [Myxococcota bacterium]